MKIHTLLNAIITLGWVVCIPLLCVAEVEEARDYKVGVILPLSGSLAFAGNEVRDSIELAASELSSSTTRFSFKFEDNGAGATATAAAANKFINVDHVDAVISLWPEAANVVAPISERKGVLHYTIAWDPNIACSNKLVFSHQAMVDDYVEATLQVLKKNKATKIAFFHDSVFQQGAEILQEVIGGHAMQIAETFVFDRGKTDFRAELTKTKAAEADSLLIWSIMPETEIFLKQVAQQRIDLFVSGFFDVVQDLSLIEGRPFPSEVYATSGFQEKFKQRYGKATVMKGPNAYDVVKLLALAIEKTGEIKPKPLSIKRQLLKIRDYPGAVGSVSIDECGNSSYPIVTKIVTNGKLEVLGG